MNIVPDEELKPKLSFNFAPMIDFLFIMLAFFATLAVTRATLYDLSLDLVQMKPEPKSQISNVLEEPHHINLSISKTGGYSWLTEIHQYPMDSLKKIQKELVRQHTLGILPEKKDLTKVLLHIDKQAPWDSIAKLVFAVKEVGFDVNPIYEGEE